MQLRVVSAYVVVAMFLTGCPHDEFVIEMIPQGQRVERRITGWQQDESLSENGERTTSEAQLAAVKLASWASLYGDRLSAPDQARQSFEGTFDEAMPADVGGFGRYVHLPTTMGAASVYMERFGGEDAQAMVVENVMDQFECAVPLVTGWLEHEIGREPGFEDLKTYLDGQLRNDVKNLSIYYYVWGSRPDLVDDPKWDTVMFVQWLLYAAERGLVTPRGTMLTALDGDLLEGNFGLILQRLVAARMGVPGDEPVPAALDFLTAEKIEGSFSRYAVGKKAYKRALKKWAGERKSDPKLPKPDPGDVLYEDECGGKSFVLFGLNDSRSHLRLSLAAPVEPWNTNGLWDQGVGVVRWDEWVPSKESGKWPSVATAMWSEPDEAFQKAHLGRTALEGEELHKYCLWHHDLTADERHEWDSFLASLSPGDGLTERLAAFGFSTGPHEISENAEDPRQSRVRRGADLITKGLKAK
jgi:hypothetical protein